MNIIPYTVDLEPEWRAFVTEHPDRSIGHVPEMAEFERVASGASNHSLVVRDDRDRLVGVVPLFLTELRELRALRTRVLSSGTTVPSGPLLATALSARQQAELTDAIVARMVQEARALGADVVSIAYPTVLRGKPAVEALGVFPLRRHGFRETNVVALISDLSRSEDELLASIDSKARNLIKRCRSAGGEVRRIATREEWMQADELNRITLGSGAYAPEAMQAFWSQFLEPAHAGAVGVYLEGRLISVVSMTLVGAASYYWLSFNLLPSPVPGANSLALWEAMLLAKRSGAVMFELGSLEFDEPKQVRIGRFKAQFGGRPVYALAGVKQLRPLRRASLDLIGQAMRAIRGRRTSEEKAIGDANG